jgi:hypothetical protein
MVSTRAVRTMKEGSVTSVAILQSNYLPWKGYFDIIAAVDTFVVYDCVQYTKRDWRNRNRIKAAGGPHWLTVPVHCAARDTRIDQVSVLDQEILRRHWLTIERCYRRADGFDDLHERVHPLFDRPAPESLSELNVSLIKGFCDILGIDTPIVDSSAFSLTGDRNVRLVEICRQAGATTYLSGPAARDYIDEEVFGDAGVHVEWMDYGGYPEYEQPFPPFDHHVSIVDLVLCTGDRAPDFMLQVR